MKINQAKYDTKKEEKKDGRKQKAYLRKHKSRKV